MSLYHSLVFVRLICPNRILLVNKINEFDYIFYQNYYRTHYVAFQLGDAQPVYGVYSYFTKFSNSQEIRLHHFS